MIPPVAYAIAYLVITTLLWWGDRGVGIKRPMASAAKWFVWTAAWFSFSAMTIGVDILPPTIDNAVMPLAISVFVYPMILMKPTPGMDAFGIALLWAGPLAASAVGYVLAVRHNVHRTANPLPKADPRRARGR